MAHDGPISDAEYQKQINDLNVFVKELSVYQKKEIAEMKIREENPAAMKAWKNYQSILKLCK